MTRSNSLRPSILRLFYAGVLSAVMLLGACATNPATGGRDFVLMSEDAEIAQGRELHPKVMQVYDEYDDAELQALVKNVGTTLAENSERNNLIFRFTLLDSDQVNAFALPGGYIYITRGLLAYLNSEAELAAVLGHEIGHVTARHSVRQQTKSTLAGLAGMAVAIGTGSSDAYNLSQLLGAAVLSGYGRKMELEADALGARYLANNAYTPQAMIDVISVLKDQEVYEKDRAVKENREPRVYHGLFSTHPRNDTRLQEVIEEASSLAPDAPAVSVAEREAFIRMQDQMLFDKPAKEGITRGNSFYHKDLDFAFDFPAAWRVENFPAYIDIYAPANAAIIRMGTDDLNKKITPREFLIERVKVKRMHSDEALEINGMPAHTAMGRGTTPWGTRDIRYTVIYQGERAYVFQSAVKDKNMHAEFDPFFQTTAASFRYMSDADTANAKPQRLVLHRVQAGETIESLTANSPIPVYAAEQIRLLNALYPDLQPQSGQLIKLVE
ncbi:MAG: M48 family metalloprotease [Gammaproteobacteria bacterium]|nr:M48 family metalloprotease [Gammaproteobacteria bacterium]NNM14261.1 M48 family metalloprotease [Gammaproteobacteria bacterium]RZV38558.1 MAG: peptidase M48 [Acidimicrobiales bacterium]